MIKKPLPKDNRIEGLLWYEYLAKIEKKVHHVAVDFNDTTSCFLTSAIYFNNQEEILITFNDITEQMSKDKLLFEQNKTCCDG